MTLRFASTILLMIAMFATLIHAAQTQRDYDNALSRRLPSIAPRHAANSANSPHHAVQ